jgi:hypothetical protein
MKLLNENKCGIHTLRFRRINNTRKTTATIVGNMVNIQMSSKVLATLVQTGILKPDIGLRMDDARHQIRHIGCGD